MIGGAQLGELAGGHHDAALHRSGGLVVGFDGPIEPPPQIVHVHRHAAQAVVKLLAERADLLRIVRQLLLVPAVGDRFQQVRSA